METLPENLNEIVDKSTDKQLGGVTGKGFMPGVSGNPLGRPKGTSIKDRVRQYLEDHPDDMKAFVDHFVNDNRDLAWQMLEGRPKGDAHIELDLPQNIIDLIRNVGPRANTSIQEENPS